jgi:hypothetical protein
VEAGTVLRSEAGGLDDLGDQEQEMLQLGNILRRQLIVAAFVTDNERDNLSLVQKSRMR